MASLIPAAAVGSEVLIKRRIDDIWSQCLLCLPCQSCLCQAPWGSWSHGCPLSGWRDLARGQVGRWAQVSETVPQGSLQTTGRVSAEAKRALCHQAWAPGDKGEGCKMNGGICSRIHTNSQTSSAHKQTSNPLSLIRVWLNNPAPCWRSQAAVKGVEGVCIIYYLII